MDLLIAINRRINLGDSDVENQVSLLFNISAR